MAIRSSECSRFYLDSTQRFQLKRILTEEIEEEEILNFDLPLETLVTRRA